MDDDEKCYIFKADSRNSSKRKLKGNQTSSSKRQKKETEMDASRQLREEYCRELWNIQRNSIQDVLDEANSFTLNEITSFLSSPGSGNEASIPTGYVLAGPDTTSHASFFAQLASRVNDDGDRVLVSLSSGDSPNLKTALRSIIQQITGFDEDDDDDELGSRLRYLDYDLDKLRVWLDRRSKKLVIAFENSEAFQPEVLFEIIDQMRWVTKFYLK
jgi:origin recognition complex subunit 3